MVARHISMRGEIVDMEKLRLANGDTPALGNAAKNARGDQLGPGGIVLRTQEQIEQEWAAARARKEDQSRVVDIKSNEALQQALSNLAPKTKAAIHQQDRDWDPETPAPAKPAAAATRRRTIESD
jgi:hypothetical protein